MPRPSLQVPIQQKMIMFELLTEKEVGVAEECAILYTVTKQIQWLTNYHNLCADTIVPLLEQQGRREALQWLHRETQLIG